MALQGAVLAESGSNGAGPDVRDPMYYEKTDKVFLGTWECTSDPHSTLTIKEANPQTGGYYVDFFFTAWPMPTAMPTSAAISCPSTRALSMTTRTSGEF